MRIGPLIACVALVGQATASAALARPDGIPDGLSGVEAYERCLFLVDTRLDIAFEEALAWESRGGGVAARHCAAVALVALDQPEEAATRLQALAEGAGGGDASQRAALYGQAGNAWLLANRAEAAKLMFDAALKLQPRAPELLIDRARARAALGDLKAARGDLDLAIVRDTSNPIAYLFRASARRKLGDLAGAALDVETALKLAPGDADVLLERGRIRMARGDREGARADFVAAASAERDATAASAARAELENLDLKR